MKKYAQLLFLNNREFSLNVFSVNKIFVNIAKW